MEEIATIPEDELGRFSNLFEHSSNLKDILAKLPGHLVLESGLSAKRKSLISAWADLESPNLDGTVDSNAFKSISKWIHEAEITLAHIVNTARDKKSLSFPEEEFGPEFEVVSNSSEIECVSDEWCWPWPKKRIGKKISKESADKTRLIKYGALASLGVIALVAFMDEGE